MKKIFTITLLTFCFSIFVKAQSPQFGIKFGGFVREDIYFDSRQVEQLREGMFLYYPLNANLDKNGNDINAKSSLNMLAIGARLSGAITGPDAFGAKTSGLLEGEFFGASNANINTFRLRHAYLKLNWSKTELLFGQTWHALFTEDCIPMTLSFNTGSPFQPFNRSPQIRLKHKWNNFTFIVSANTQRDFSSTGPAGISSAYLANSILPEFNAGVIFSKHVCDSAGVFSYGVIGEYKQLTPRLLTKDTIATSEKVESAAVSSFIKFETKKWGIKLKAVYGQNLYDQQMLGGYAIKYYGGNIPANADYEYTPTTVTSIWTDIFVKQGNITFGLFGGYSKNLGSAKNIQDWDNSSNYYSRGYDIDNIYRLAPRVSYDYNKLKLAIECEYTAATYGNQRNSLGVIQDKSIEFPAAKLTEVANTRILGVIQYNF